jgi:pyruvate dehydrogenase E2 component (dihydrolipoamide acetyltransferase)
MAVPVEVPKLGNTVEECLIAKWRKHKGDPVSAGEVVAEIETDKATFEIPSPVNGALLETFFDEGTLVPVFTNLFVVGEPGESADAFRPPSAAPASPRAAEANPETPQAPVKAPARTEPVAPPPASAGHLSPRARRFAEEHGMTAEGMPMPAGSGPGGRVLEEDLRELYYSSRGPDPKGERILWNEETRGQGPKSVDTSVVRRDDAAGTSSRATSIREKIARRMRESLASTAQYTLNASADAGGLLSLRARIKTSIGVPDINLNDLVTFCAIRALLEMPALNAEFIDGKIHNHSEVHLGFACDTPRGLLVPVVRNAHQLDIGDLASAMKALTAQAVQGSISPDYLSGATFTVSNLGGLGIESFTPLLNPPQVAILGVGAIQVKPVRRHGTVEFMDAIGLSLTCDHQVIDGAPGARFLQIVKEKIENVESVCTI